MRNQAIIAAAMLAAALAGCGGAGTGDGGTDTTTGTATATTANPTTTATATTSGFTGATVNLKPTPGQVELTFLTGQARSTAEPGDVNLQIGRVTFTDSDGQTIGNGDTVPRLGLNAYNFIVYRTNATVLPSNSRLLSQVQLSVTSLTATNQDGVEQLPITTVANTPITLPLEARLSPNRYTSIPVFINDAQFPITESDDPTVPASAVFDRAQFNADNGVGIGLRARIPSFFSDYVRFDVSGMAAGDRPNASDGAPVDYVLFSGDNYAVAANRASTLGNGGLLFESVNLNRFDPDLPTEALIPGNWKANQTVPDPDGTNGRVPGTYNLRQPNPVFDPRVSFITAVQGLFKDFGTQLANIGATQAVSFPNNLNTSRQDLVVVDSTAGDGNSRAVSAMYYGYLDYADSSVHLFPIRNLTTASAEGEIVGSISDLRDASLNTTRNVSSVRYGTWTAALPGIGAGSGSFTVYRR